MGNFEAFSQDTTEIKEIDWVQQQVKAELQDLQKQSFYSTWEDGKVNYDMDAVKNYLTTIKQKNWSELTSKNSSAWIMAVQIALEERGIDVGKVDGIFGAGTRAAVRTFQEENKINADGLPGPQTIEKLLEGIAETPANTTETPANTAETPANTTETPANTTETPANTTETPANTTETPANTTETGTETSEKMDLTKVNIDVLKKVYGETIDKNWKGFQEKRNVIEIWGLKFKKWTEGMTGLGYKVRKFENNSSIMLSGQYVDGYLTGKGVMLRSDGDLYEWDFVDDQENWKGTYYRKVFPSWRVLGKQRWVRKEGEIDGRGVTTYSDWEKFEGHRERGRKKWRGTTTYPNGDKHSINYENNNEWKWDYIFSTGEKIYGEWNHLYLWERECTKKIYNSKEPLKVKISTWLSDWIIEATSSENTIKIKVEKDYFVFQPESPRLAFPRGRKFDPFAIAHALNWAIKHVKDTQQKGTYKFDQFESSFSWDFVQVDREWAALDSDLIDTRKYPGMNATKVSDWLNANAKAFGLLNTKK